MVVALVGTMHWPGAEAIVLVKGAAAAVPATGGLNASSFSVCNIIGSHLPSKCKCNDYDTSTAQINCTIDFLGRDEIDVSATISPCSMPAYLELRVEEEKHHIGHTFGPISAEGTKDYPVPGLSIDIPKIGEAGINAALGIDGDVENLKIEIGLDVSILNFIPSNSPVPVFF